MTTQYREFKRKANAGERIRIVKPIIALTYGKDSEGVVTNAFEAGVHARMDENDGSSGILHEEYVVLEPVAQLTPAPPQRLAFPEALALFMRENAAAIRKYLDEIEAQTPVTTPPVAQPKPLTRAEVIAKAKADVAELERIGGAGKSDLPKGTPFHNRFYTVVFHVNREKRAVTALVHRGLVRGLRPDAKATAKCAPGDVFHAEIGKAIALRRALGLEVPAEYINAPKPDEPRVGAVVAGVQDRGFYSVDKRFTLTLSRGDGSYWYAERLSDWIEPFQIGEILDDTGVDYGAVTDAACS